jgi:FkbM family methyltransferase
MRPTVADRLALAMMVILRTRLLMLIMRLARHERLTAWQLQGRFRALAPLLQRGQIQITGGPGVQLRLDAAHFAFWGAQSYGVLTGEHERQVQEALRRAVGPGDVVWDVGANVGMLSLVAARMVGPTGRVVALEPDQSCAAAIRANARSNAMDGIDVHEVAATARSGDVELVVVADRLWTRLASVGEHELETERRTVPGVALDDLQAPRPTLVKIDVEGAELDVLDGMQRLLAEVQPVVVCEMHGKNREFCAAMREAGYVVVNLDGPEPVEAAGDNVHALCVPAGRAVG